MTVEASQAGDANYLAATSVTRTFTVGQATATVTLAGLSHTYDGIAKVVTATTVPVGLKVDFTYAGSATAPTAAGSYAVVGTVVHTNYVGSATGTLVIGKASQTITFAAIADRDYSTTPIALGGTASSGLGVSYSLTRHHCHRPNSRQRQVTPRHRRRSARHAIRNSQPRACRPT